MDYDKLIAPAAEAMRPSGIRKFFDLAAEMPECISLGVGEPDFKTPWAVREAGIESLEHGRTRYTSNAGLKELRAEVAKYLERRMGLHYDPLHEVLITVGGSEAIDMCIRTLVQPGDEVIIPEPCFVCYEPITTLSGGVPVHVACRQEDEFRLRADALKAAITPKTKLLIMPFPNNPTGAVMEREDLEAVAEVLRGTNIMVLSDEIYAELNYGLRPHVSVATLPGMAERTIVVNGFSKTYAMTGWRLGYACGPAPIIRIMTKIHQSAIMSAPTTSQYAAITALKECDGEIDRMRDEYNMRRRLVVKSFNDMGLTCFEPRGAFYAFPCIKSTGMSSQDFCTKLLEQKHVAIIPGDAFGASGEGYARISYAYSVEHLKEALRRIRESCRKTASITASEEEQMARLNCVTILAPAKLNLALDVVGLLPGGYHDLDMTMQAITLYERVVLRRSPYLNLRLPGSLVAPNNKNTAIKAALAFFDYTGLLAGVDITIYKNTPVRAGMAGGSADAAAVLVGMNELYGAYLSMSELCALGAKIGADVPFALMGGTCRVQGVGDFLKALPPVPECWFTVVMPDYGVSTPEAFAAYDRVGSSIHPDCGAQEAAIRAGDLDVLCAAAGNALEECSGAKDTGAIKALLREHGAVTALMTGSGAAVFGVFRDEGAARAAAQAAKRRWKQVYVAQPDRGGARVSR